MPYHYFYNAACIYHYIYIMHLNIRYISYTVCMYQSYISEVRMQRCLYIHQTRERFRYVIFVDKICANGRIAFHQKSSDLEKKCNIISKTRHTFKVNKLKMVICNIYISMEADNEDC